jgi:hypothetical protein
MYCSFAEEGLIAAMGKLDVVRKELKEEATRKARALHENIDIKYISTNSIIVQMGWWEFLSKS